MTLRLTSTAFIQASTIPARFTCDGDNLSPPLAWSGAPPATRSFALKSRADRNLRAIMLRRRGAPAAPRGAQSRPTS